MLPVVAFLAIVAYQVPGQTPASGIRSPVSGIRYFQQSVRYTIAASLDEPSGTLGGIARLDYRNNSPDTLREMYFHLFLNAFRPGSLWSADERREGIDRFARLPEPYNAFEHLGDVMIDGTRVVP